MSDDLNRRINTRGAVQLMKELLEAYRAEAWENAIKSHGLKDHEIRDMVNELHVTAEQYAGTQQLRERIARCVLKHIKRGDLRYGVLPPLTAAVPLAPFAFQESGTATVGPFGSVAHPKNRQQAEMMVSIALDWLTKNSRDYKHRKGGTYLKLATATVQVQSSLTDMDKVVVYIGEDGEWWVRHPEEFEERFTKL